MSLELILGVLTKPVLELFSSAWSSHGRRQNLRRTMRQRGLLPYIHVLHDPKERREVAENLVYMALNIANEDGVSFLQVIGLAFLKATWIEKKIEVIDEVFLEPLVQRLQDVKIEWDEDDFKWRVEDGDEQDAIEEVIKDMTRVIWGI